ncbi:FmdB family zinc ribbon protein [Zeimonas arvi]|uniref:Zinc ribbon domain-containing protein n=1 Tax=Zeimonas arvi TaxID=2498847 RepID=A0A5C8NSX6_9BURK|nr:FmdB family zinc ribbon protein [Zeimonas arvi]TXL64318.1 zinc ribbon domain-containing protein [Zeimonas arvi]
MPIYAYRCDSCGARKDVLQKVSDAALTTCPECGAESFRKELTAPAFQLKGSGWYVTDFRDKGKPKDKPAGDAAGGAPAPSGSDAGGSTSTSASASSGSASTPAPAAPSA